VKPLAALLAATCLLAASCGGSSEHLASPAKTQDCLSEQEVTFGGQLDFVATTATGGALKAHLKDNDVTLVFGQTVADANNINDAYHRFHAQNVGIDDVLRQVDNVVMLWQAHPSDADLALVTNCLK
jgi:hypothetical protein